MKVRVSFQYETEIEGEDIKEFAQDLADKLIPVLTNEAFELTLFEVEQLDYPEIDIENL